MTHALQQGAADHPRNHRRREAAAYVREKHNVPCTEATLATLACRGGGPRFYLFGRIPIYNEEDLDAWVERSTGRAGSKHLRGTQPSGARRCPRWRKRRRRQLAVLKGGAEPRNTAPQSFAKLGQGQRRSVRAIRGGRLPMTAPGNDS